MTIPMNTDPDEKSLALPDPTHSPGEDAAESSDGAKSTSKAALGLALYTASTAVRLTSRLGGFIFSPVKRVYRSASLEPMRSHFDRLIERGETEVDEWIQTGLSKEPGARQAVKNVADPLVEVVVGYLSTHPAIEKLIKEQIEQLAKQSPELPQINILVRVLADNYINYLNENPELVKQLVRDQGEIFIDHLEENPKQVQELVQGQSVGMISEITDEVRERMVTGDSALEALARRLFRRRPRSELPEPPTEVQARALQARLPGDFPRLEGGQPDDQ